VRSNFPGFDMMLIFSSVKSGIRQRMSDYIVSENSWPLFLYENYTIDHDNLEKGLFKSKLLVQVSDLRLL